MKILSLSSEYKEKVERIAVDSWGGIEIAVHRELYDLRELPCIMALSDDHELLGYCYYRIFDGECEIMAIEATKPNIGVGSTLINEVIGIAVNNGCRRVYLQTTNDNTHAFRFYQRRGFIMCAVRWNELDYSRKIKPTIPLTGDDDIPLLHEIEFELVL